MSVDWRIQSLAANHIGADFRCGEPVLDTYISRHASLNHGFGVSRTFVAVSEAQPSRILGYYSLCAGSIDKTNLPKADVRRFPGYPVPFVKLAKLAVDSSQQGVGIGGSLLFDAMRRCLRVADDVGIAGVIIDAKHEKAKEFYSRYEFNALTDHPLTLWLALPDLRRIYDPQP